MIESVINLFGLVFAAAAVIYGYFNWRRTKDRIYLRWLVVGIIFCFAVAFGMITITLSGLSKNAQIIFYWTRLICDVGAVLLALTLKVK